MKITREQLKQIILEELNESTGDEVMNALGDQYGPSNRSQLGAKFTQHTADFQHVVDEITNAYGNERVRDVATELVRMIANEDGLNTDTLAWPRGRNKQK